MNIIDNLVEIIDKCVADGCHSGCPFEQRCLRDNKQFLLSEVLHYLKEYQKIEDEYEELKDWWAEEHAENVPLSWEQLKTMEGKPVLIELLNHDMWDDPSHRVDSEWWVIGEVRKDDIILATYLDEMELCEEDIDISWKAYRKERC